jgi:cold shock CspA family protein
LTMPGHREVNISRDPGRNHAHEDLGVTIRDAFKAARRRLQDRVRRQRGEVKVHEPAPNGTIARLIAEQDYGFIAAADGREVYFHRNSVANGKFEALQVGEKVRFVEAMGEKGPQATYVAPAGRSAPAASRGKAGGGA